MKFSAYINSFFFDKKNISIDFLTFPKINYMLNLMITIKHTTIEPTIIL